MAGGGLCRNKRCVNCCPICKHQCQLRERHPGMLHECSKHYWGTKGGRRAVPIDLSYAEIADDVAQVP